MTRAVRAACLLSLAIGLLFVFVRAPHPWGWNGFDHYHELALALDEVLRVMKGAGARIAR